MQYCELPGPVIAMEGNWMTKITVKKNRKHILKNVGQRHNIANSRSLRLRWGNWMTKIRAEKIELTFSIFSTAIFVTQFSSIASVKPSNSRYCVFVKQFENFKFAKRLLGRTLGDENHCQNNR